MEKKIPTETASVLKALIADVSAGTCLGDPKFQAGFECCRHEVLKVLKFALMRDAQVHNYFAHHALRSDDPMISH